MMSRLDQHFGLSRQGTTVRKEVLAGVTTFLAMAYITVVNPAILSDAGMDFGGVFVATCLAAALGTLIMGLYANYPIAMAPGMGQNTFFAYGIVIGMGHSWQTALGAVFISGLIFIALSLFPVREKLVNAIPASLKMGISAGIGLFLGIISLTGSGLIQDHPVTLVSMGDFRSAPALLMMFGFILIAALAARQIVGAVVIGMLAVTLVGWATGTTEIQGLVSLPPSMSGLFAMDLGSALQWSMVTVILTLLLVDVFDTAGTLVGVASRADMLDKDGKLPRLRQALLADSTATAAGSLLGTSSTTSFIESAAGVESGGRTGLTAVTVAGLFLLCLFLAPLAQSIPSFATGAALLFVACLMVRSMAELDWDNLTESIPAVVTAIAIPLTYSIADGIGLGFICYASIKLLAGKYRECAITVYAVAIIFLLKFLLL